MQKKDKECKVTGTVQSENGLLSLLTQEVIMPDEDGLNLLISSGFVRITTLSN